MAERSDAVRVFTWAMAEELAEGHMRSIGFRDARRSPAGVDGGIDVASSQAVAQVKNHAAPVGAPDVQRLRGAAHRYDHYLFYSAAGYTRAAVDYADAAGVALFQFDASASVWPVNAAGRSVSTASHAPDLARLGEEMMLARELVALLESNAELNATINEETTKIERYSITDHDEQIRLADQLVAYINLNVELAALPAQESLTTSDERRSFLAAHYSYRERAAALFDLDLAEFPVVWDTST